jgi:hypothetical protein
MTSAGAPTLARNWLIKTREADSSADEKLPPWVAVVVVVGETVVVVVVGTLVVVVVGALVVVVDEAVVGGSSGMRAATMAVDVVVATVVVVVVGAAIGSMSRGPLPAR